VELPADRGELGPGLRDFLASLGPRPRQAILREALVRLCSVRPFTAVELSRLVGVRSDKLVERHLRPMVVQGLLARIHPDTTSHPAQAYRATATPLALNPNGQPQSDRAGNGE